MTDRLYLTGPMGSGKSTIGQLLARRLAWDFLDLDDAVQQRAGRTIAQIFRDQGERAFREVERAALHDTATRERTIIATGGGVPIYADNAAWMNRHGLTVYLRTPAAVLAPRLWNEYQHRPLLRHLNNRDELEARMEKMIAQRTPYYERAQVIYEQTTGHEPVVEELAKYVLRIRGER